MIAFNKMREMNRPDWETGVQPTDKKMAKLLYIFQLLLKSPFFLETLFNFPSIISFLFHFSFLWILFEKLLFRF